MIRSISIKSILQQASCPHFCLRYPTAYDLSISIFKFQNGARDRGTQGVRTEGFRTALGFFRQAANESPESVEADHRLGYMAAVMSESEEALGAYQKIAELRPSAVRSYWLGKFAGDIGETSIAVEALQKSLSDSSRNGGEELTAAQRQHVKQYLFRVLLEIPDRERALSFVRSQGWVQEEIDFCKPPPSLGISSETAGLLALLIHPKRAECSLQVGKDLTEMLIIG